MKIEQVSVGGIRPFDKNAKKHTEEQIKKVAASIERFGFVQPLVVDKDGVLIIGHCRLLAAKMLKIESVPVLRAEHLTEQEVAALRLADNKLNESEWDMGLVVEELKVLSDELLELTGFDKDLIIEPDEKDDEVPDVPEEPQSKLGDLYELGNHRVLCGDSTKIEDVERLMDGKKADMVFTDPPYNVDYEGKTKERLKIQNDRNSLVEFREMISSVIDNMVVFTKRGGCYYVCIPLEVGVTDLFLEKTHLQSVIIWLKNIIVMGRKDYQQKTEPILFMTNIEDKGYTEENAYQGIVYGWKAGDSHDFYGGRKQSNVWEFDKPSISKEHPTMKPIALCAKGIANSSKTDNIVLDLFGGSGSTLIACEQLNRTCYMMELDPKYVDVIVQRYVDYTGNASVVKNGKTILWKKTPTLNN